MAFFAAARHIYLEEPDGDHGFWVRLKAMSCKAFYIYGRQDVLITPHFGRKVQVALPKAKVEVWDDCGHVPATRAPPADGERDPGVPSRFDERQTPPGRQARLSALSH